MLGRWMILGCLLAGVACTPDYGPLLDRACTLNLDCPSGLCVQGYCSLDVPADEFTEPPLSATGCQAVGAPCDPSEAQPVAFVCIDGDSTRPGEATCHSTCGLFEPSDPCTQGSFCSALTPDLGVCLRSNCDSPVSSVRDCAGLSDNGGTCFPQGNDAFYCFPAGDRKMLDACSQVTPGLQCEAGLACVGGLCESQCSLMRNNEDCPVDRVCLPNSPFWGVCVEPCTAFEDETCGPARTCLPLSDGEGFCRQEGESPAGATCQENESCIADTLCIYAEPNRPQVCTWTCEVSAGGLENPRCVSGEVCVPFVEGGGDFGVCVSGCAPFSEADPCTQPDLQTCWPFGADRGYCRPSGQVPVGAACTLSGGSALGQCEAGAICKLAPGQPQGVCESLCRLASGVLDCPSGSLCFDNFGDPLVGSCGPAQ